MPDQPNDPTNLESRPQDRPPEKPEGWQPEKETDPSKLVDIADPSAAPEEGAY
ncbi:MAG: hypothetical protein QM765_14085 [Myxococcales bacterium]